MGQSIVFKKNSEQNLKVKINEGNIRVHKTLNFGYSGYSVLYKSTFIILYFLSYGSAQWVL